GGGGAGGGGEGGGGEGGGGPARRQQVLPEREVEHLLRRDMRDHPPPAKHRLERVRGQSLVFALLEGEGREQVLAHDSVLELPGLAEHVDQRLAVLDHEWRLRRRLATARRDHLRKPAATRGRRVFRRLGHRARGTSKTRSARISSSFGVSMVVVLIVLLCPFDDVRETLEPFCSQVLTPSKARFSAHRLLHERADPCLFGGGQLLQREGDRPQAAVIEVRVVAEAE